ncbi:hypothetical protein FHR96_001192 [Halomonas organivorans]|uniref:Reverse transcriptase domain-containing protein n=1 Tax=Halomonas organivorans TaxID=257772 RepID=A0A7W5G4T1_9GAMM|nr:hypothetical protein [Halomonas organivorans]
MLTPIFDPGFSASSYGYRPKRSAQQAVSAMKAHVTAGHRWVVDLDLAAFFDPVNHDLLMARVARRVRDKRVLRLIRRYLEAGMFGRPGRATPTGNASGRTAESAVGERPAGRRGQGTGTPRPPLLPLRRRHAGICQESAGGRTRHDQPE